MMPWMLPVPLSQPSPPCTCATAAPSGIIPLGNRNENPGRIRRMFWYLMRNQFPVVLLVSLCFPEGLLSDPRCKWIQQ
jgi:hypothetical protein